MFELIPLQPENINRISGAQIHFTSNVQMDREYEGLILRWSVVFELLDLSSEHIVQLFSRLIIFKELDVLYRTSEGRQPRETREQQETLTYLRPLINEDVISIPV